MWLFPFCVRNVSLAFLMVYVSTVPPIPSMPSLSFSSLLRSSPSLVVSLSRMVVLEAPVSIKNSMVSRMVGVLDSRMAAT